MPGPIDFGPTAACRSIAQETKQTPSKGEEATPEKKEKEQRPLTGREKAKKTELR